MAENLTTATNPPSAESVVKLIDAEINHLLNEQKRPGWTPWALAASIAATIWFFGQQDLSKVRWSVFFVCVALLDAALLVLQLIVRALDDRDDDSSHRRYRLPGINARETRLHTATQAIKQVIGACLIVYVFRVGVRSAIVGLCYPGVFVYRVARSMWRQKRRRASRADDRDEIWSIVGLISTTAVSIAGEAHWIRGQHITLIEARCAALTVVGVTLLTLLSNDARQPSLFTSLIRKRRELMFGHVSPADTLRDVETILLGMRLEEVVQAGLRKTLSVASDFQRSHEEVRKLLAEADTLLAWSNEILTGPVAQRSTELFARARRVFDAAAEERSVDEVKQLTLEYEAHHKGTETIADEAEKKAEETERTAKSIGNKLREIVGLTRTFGQSLDWTEHLLEHRTDPAAREIIARVSAAHEEMIRRDSDLEDKFNRISLLREALREGIEKLRSEAEEMKKYADQKLLPALTETGE
jgi:hypothetical protein